MTFAKGADIRHTLETATSAVEKSGLKHVSLIMRMKKLDPLMNDSNSGNENAWDENFVYPCNYT